jgi:hypothetical protein
MPKYLLASVTESHRLRLRQALEHLLENATHGVSSATAFARARRILEALPLTREEYGVACNALANAQRDLQAGEAGAARWQLRQLLHSVAE